MLSNGLITCSVNYLRRTQLANGEYLFIISRPIIAVQSRLCADMLLLFVLLLPPAFLYN